MHKYENDRKYDGIHLFGWGRRYDIRFTCFFYFLPPQNNNLSLSKPKGCDPTFWLMHNSYKQASEQEHINIFLFVLFSERGKCGT